MLDKILISGSSGFGKSTLAKAMCKRKKRLVVFDPLDEYAALGMKRVTTLTELRQAVLRSSGGAFKIAYHPAGLGDTELPAALNRLCKMLMQGQQPYKDGRSPSTLCLVIEEASIAAPNHQQKKGDDGFSYCARIGRHYGIEIIAVTQRYKEVLKTFRGNCPTQIYFRMTEPTDVAEIEKLGGMDDYRGVIGKLPVHAYVKLHDGKASTGKNKL